MLSESAFLRWEHTTPPHNKFYEVEVELSLFYPKILVRRWGRIGARRQKSLRTMVPDPTELERQVGFITRRRQRHGYCQIREVRVPAIGADAA